MSKQAEARLKDRIRKAVLAAYPGAYVRKLADKHTRGLPDLVVCFRKWGNEAGTLWVEAKTDEGRLSKLQVEERHAVLKLDAPRYCYSIVARDVETVLRTLEDMGAVK